jgi:hypothetical protein
MATGSKNDHADEAQQQITRPQNIKQDTHVLEVGTCNWWLAVSMEAEKSPCQKQLPSND